MKGATVLGTHPAAVVQYTVDRTSDDQTFLELKLRRDTPLGILGIHMNGQSIPAFRAWFPLSPKSLAELAVMGVKCATVNGPVMVDPSARFLIDLVSVPCSDEEAHGAEAQRLFVRNPRPLTERK